MINNKNIATKLKTTIQPASIEPSHWVQFYRSKNDLIQPLTDYIESGIRSGDRCIVIATYAHIEELNNGLTKRGLDVTASQLSGRYVTLDAAETLAKFMVNGLPHQQSFFSIFGSLIENSLLEGQPVRAYGEMVALLWKEGNREGVLQLEKLWNDLAELHSFSLYCAYPELHFIMDKPDQKEIVKCHDLYLSNSGGLPLLSS